MNVDELVAAFKTANILLVRVEYLDDSVDSRGLRVSGELSDFIAAAKALLIPVVFVYAEKLDAGDFFYRHEDNEAEESLDETAVSTEQDLCLVNIELEQFKKYVGEIGSFTLYAAIQPKGLTYFIENEWYAHFWECRDSITESIEQQDVDSQADRDEEEDKQLGALRARLDELVTDKKFARLPTQKAMVEYAKLHVSGIDGLDSADLRDAISELRARIIAKGIL